MSTNTSQLAAYIWSLADLLRGDFKQSQYGRVILPFTILRRLECVLEATKDKVLKVRIPLHSISRSGRIRSGFRGSDQASERSDEYGAGQAVG